MLEMRIIKFKQLLKIKFVIRRKNTIFAVHCGKIKTKRYETYISTFTD